MSFPPNPDTASLNTWLTALVGSQPQESINILKELARRFGIRPTPTPIGLLDAGGRAQSGAYLPTNRVRGFHQPGVGIAANLNIVGVVGLVTVLEWVMFTLNPNVIQATIIATLADGADGSLIQIPMTAPAGAEPFTVTIPGPHYSSVGGTLVVSIGVP